MKLPTMSELLHQVFLRARLTKLKRYLKRKRVLKQFKRTMLILKKIGFLKHLQTKLTIKKLMKK